ncbi:plasmid stabilization protein [Pelagibacterium sediminicola]|uniref:plasmid stabilization protein n=1 Tax=Pelagibacterium sediminicola TaxID=2248761 RepID=UPI000E314A2F|nr:plasmid stabilization protein [Pelagibacterium sediminicola]
MAQPQLSVRSAKARDLAHRLAARENRTIAEVVERALEMYAVGGKTQSPAPDFFTRLVEENPIEEDFDWDTFLAEQRKPHKGIDL